MVFLLKAPPILMDDSAFGLVEQVFLSCKMSPNLLKSKVILPEFSMYDVPLAYVGVV